MAGRCDWAATADGMGFSGVDAPLGHALADKTIWSPRETITVTRLLTKYKKQVAAGGIDVDGLEALSAAYKEEAANLFRLRKREMISGTISVDGKKIVLKTGYNGRLVVAIRELVGSCWDKEKNTWAVDLCQENALEVEGIAKEFGLDLQKSKNWAKLVPMLKARVLDNRLVVSGCNAYRIRDLLPKRSGKPSYDETLFSSLTLIDRTSFYVPLTSWNIHQSMLWLEEMDEEHPLFASQPAIRLALSSAYEPALASERAATALSAAISFHETNIEPIRSLLPSAVGDGLLPHQWAGVKFVMENRQCILADEQGVGKTLEILAGLEAAKAFPAIIICPSGARLVWRDHAVAWLPHRTVAVLGIAKRDAGVPIGEADIVIVNYESFHKYEPDMSGIKPAAVCMDEAQYLKGYDSQRTKAVKEFCQTNKPGRIIAVTGTPVMNTPSELLTLLTLLPDVLAALGGFFYVAARYCRATDFSTTWTSWCDYSGSGNLDELNSRLRATAFLRREKSAVFPDLPPKIVEQKVVTLQNMEEYIVARDDFSNWLKKRNSTRNKKVLIAEGNEDTAVLTIVGEELGIDDIYFGNPDDRHEALRRAGALRRLTGLGKIQEAVEWISLHSKTEKVVVFAYHIEVQTAILAQLPGALSITGEQAPGARAAAILKFQDDPASMVIVCSLKAAGTAITLHAARRALFVEMDWTPSGMEQAEDRIHRYGQKQQVIITYLNAPETLDKRMNEILSRKRAVVSAVSSTARHGYKSNGTARLQPPGPGRPRMSDAERAEHRKSSKAGWQARNLEYMKEYMRKRREAVKEKKQISS